MRSWIVAGAVFALAGCSEIPSSHAYVLMSDRMDEKSQLSRYNAELASGDIALLDGKVNLFETFNRAAPPCEHLTADGYPTSAESAALRRWAELRAAYFERYHTLELRTGAASDKVAPLAQRYVDALKEDLRRSTTLIFDLADGKLSYCQFAARQKEATIASSDRARPLHKEMIAAMVEEHYFEGTGLGGGVAEGAAFYGMGITGPGGMAGAAHLHSK
jgi:hypothetical protein